MMIYLHFENYLLLYQDPENNVKVSGSLLCLMDQTKHLRATTISTFLQQGSHIYF
ncbi:hypothetical protein [Vibrio sp. D431a]|uniref:hypothetical protein n=1 Tax=Vibrio sp. D431a TaxID=2837388 RepID=UPI002554950D|nr:hypothetical protein [Vibrio sp. D431a]MDK9789798.1 hypothetical protein [Vibrio sp. D431a]